MVDTVPEVHDRIKAFFQKTFEPLGITEIPITMMSSSKMPFLTAEKINELILKADVDGSKTFNYDEVTTFMISMFKAVYDEVDVNKNGTICFEEFKAVGSGAGTSEENLQKHFSEADLNSDGKLDFHEFCQALMKRM